jgi:YHS domain-containing protein
LHGLPFKFFDSFGADVCLVCKTQSIFIKKTMNRKISFSLCLGLIALLFACKQKAPEASAATVEYANKIDYICGMEVQAEYTDTCHYKGKVYAFCSESCKEEFQASPETYLSMEDNH